MKNKIIKISAVFLSVLILFSSLFVSTVSAVDAVPEDIETSDVLSDLRVMGFDIEDYKMDTAADHIRLLKFLEFGYDCKGNQSEFGLYLYIWNPTGKEIVADSILNKITIQSRSVTNVEKSDWRKLPIEVIDYSEGSEYEHVFYKLRLRYAAVKYLLQNVSKSLRCYEVSEIELHHVGETNAKSFTVGGTFTFTGYQPYHNELRNAVSTFSESVTDRTTIEIEMHPTTWKTDTSAKGVGYANELFSMYFSIPNDIIRDYGNEADFITKGLVQIDGMYDRHSINGLVVNNKTAYDGIYPYLGIEVPSDNVPFNFYSSKERRTSHGVGVSFYENPFNINVGTTHVKVLGTGSRAYDQVKVLTSVLQADISDINDFVSAFDLREALYDIWKNKGDLYYDGYFNNVNSSSGLFGDDLLYTVSSKDANGKYVDIADSIKVYAENHKPTLWDKWFHNSLFDESSYDNIKSIQVIDPMSYNSDLAVMTSEYVSDKYYVSERDVENLGSFASKSALYDKTTYLMRFAVEDYYATEVELEGDLSGKAIYFEKVIYKNVDILTFTFENQYGGRVVLPVAATPVDNVGEITPTLKPDGKPTTNIDTTDDWDDFKFIVLILAGVLFIVLLNWLCNLLGFKLSSIIAWPFKAIAKVGKAVSNVVNKSLDYDDRIRKRKYEKEDREYTRKKRAQDDEDRLRMHRDEDEDRAYTKLKRAWEGEDRGYLRKKRVQDDEDRRRKQIIESEDRIYKREDYKMKRETHDMSREKHSWSRSDRKARKEKNKK